MSFDGLENGCPTFSSNPIRDGNGVMVTKENTMTSPTWLHSTSISIAFLFGFTKQF